MRQLLALRWRLLPLLLAVCVLLAPLGVNVWKRHHISSAAQAADVQLGAKAPVRISGTPNRILIPRLTIDLPVVSQSYSAVNKTWPVSSGVANYATETAPANNIKGRTLIYGHNNRHVFGPLLNLKKGDYVYVYTANGHIFKYAYEGSRDVTPEKTAIINKLSSESAGLMMLTCDGPNFEYRHLMSFNLLEAI